LYDLLRVLKVCQQFRDWCSSNNMASKQETGGSVCMGAGPAAAHKHNVSWHLTKHLFSVSAVLGGYLLAYLNNHWQTIYDLSVKSNRKSWSNSWALQTVMPLDQRHFPICRPSSFQEFCSLRDDALHRSFHMPTTTSYSQPNA
jgi:hypothetical protein